MEYQELESFAEVFKFNRLGSLREDSQAGWFKGFYVSRRQKWNW